MRLAHTHRVVCQVDIAVVAYCMRRDQQSVDQYRIEKLISPPETISCRIRVRNKPDAAGLELLRLIHGETYRRVHGELAFSSVLKGKGTYI